MGTALAGLTVRGRCLIAAGVACVLSALALGERDILRIGVFLLALPLASVAAVARTRYRLSCTRRLSPRRVPAGQPTTVTLELGNLTRLPTGLLLVEDRIPYTLGERPRFVTQRLEPNGRREVSYPLRSEARGRFRVGPMSVRMADPFGLCELTRSFTQQDVLVVTPRTVDLPPVRLGGDRAGGGDEVHRSVAAHGDDDVATREYQHGDPLRRVHWRSTARTGQLMVRREEQPWRRSAVVLLDTRATAHRGDGPGSSFEFAVSAAASVGLHLGRTDYATRLLTDSGVDVAGGVGVEARGEPALLDALAGVELSGNPSLEPVLRVVRRSGVEGLMVAVVGTLTATDADALARLHTGGLTGIVVFVDTDSFGTSGTRQREAAQATQAHQATLLRRSGWRVLEVGHGSRLDAVWPYAARGLVPAQLRGTGPQVVAG